MLCGQFDQELEILQGTIIIKVVDMCVVFFFFFFFAISLGILMGHDML